MKRYLPGVLLVLCAVLFGGTLYALLQWRFATGDVYPPYSSLRTDPLGTMALYESLQHFPDLTVSRDHQMSNRLPPGENTTYLHLAARPGDWDELPAETARSIEGFLVAGGRLVITLTPRENFWDSPDEEDSEEEDEKKDEKKPEKTKATPSPTPKEEKELVSMADRWGLKLAHRKTKKGENPTPSTQPAKNISGLNLPAQLPWHGGMVITKPGPGWTTIYARDGEAVMAERRFGEGSMVVATDSYFMSNEAMLRDRQPGLLTWLIGANHTIIFDEAHLGIMDSPGIAALARKYRLHGVAASLIVLALLFIWKNGSSLAHSLPPARTEETVAGRDAAAGFIGLLRRNVPATGVLELCLEEWNRTFARSKKYSRREKEAVQAIVAEESARPERERDPAAAYRRICDILHRGKSKTA